MVSLQQIKELENRVLKAVEVINSLREENKSLRGRLQGYEDRILELEELIESFKKEQQQIESGILDAIRKLDSLEDSHNALNRTAASADTDAAPEEASPQPDETVPDEEKTVLSENEGDDADDEALDIF